MRLEVVLVLREEVVDVVEEVAWRVVEDCVYIGNIFINGGDLIRIFFGFVGGLLQGDRLCLNCTCVELIV